jgi:hypothetical protein
VDLVIPINLTEAQKVTPDLQAYRKYLAYHGTRTSVVIPDTVGRKIEETFIERRKMAGDRAVEELKRRMRIARLLALSFDAELSEDVWTRAVWLDEQVETRT